MDQPLPNDPVRADGSDLELLLADSEAGFSRPVYVTAGSAEPEPPTLDSFDAQILAGLVSP
jgi:hypothetical protein